MNLPGFFTKRFQPASLRLLGPALLLLLLFGAGRAVAQSADAPAETGSGGTFRFTDAEGVPHFVDQLDKVPEQYRSAVEFSPAEPVAPNALKVEIDGDHVLIPVTLRNGEASATVLMLLDTGSTLTTITEELAHRLQIANDNTLPTSFRVADGRIIAARITRIDELNVGDKSLLAPAITIIPRIGEAQRYDGLLGMNFLRQNPYQIDYDQALLRWQ